MIKTNQTKDSRHKTREELFVELEELQRKVDELEKLEQEYIKAFDRLQGSEEKYRAFFEQSADSIVVLDAKTGEFLDFNDKAHLNLGYTREEFKKLKVADVKVNESPDEVNPIHY